VEPAVPAAPAPQAAQPAPLTPGESQDSHPYATAAHLAPEGTEPSTSRFSKQENPYLAGDQDAPQKPSRGREALEWLLVIVGAVLAAVLVRAFVVEPYEIPTESMVQTIQVGDRILGEKITYRFEAPQAGDIVTFIDPEDNSTTLIKRVIATEGQTIDLKNGAVYIDGELQIEPYTNGLPTDPITRYAANLSETITYPYTLQEGELWVMGDNRTNSLDSRYFGPISVDSVTSKAMFIFWPFNDATTL
jgi:signal peptidase I